MAPVITKLETAYSGWAKYLVATVRLSGGETVRRMLEFLWQQGRVLVSQRDGQARLWDLPERVLPARVLKQRALTPLQMTRFYAAIANGGNLVTPHIVHRSETVAPLAPSPPKQQ